MPGVTSSALGRELADGGDVERRAHEALAAAVEPDADPLVQQVRGGLGLARQHGHPERRRFGALGAGRALAEPLDAGAHHGHPAGGVER